MISLSVDVGQLRVESVDVAVLGDIDSSFGEVNDIFVADKGYIRICGAESVGHIGISGRSVFAGRKDAASSGRSINVPDKVCGSIDITIIHRLFRHVEKVAVRIFIHIFSSGIAVLVRY